jgi:uncharacterized protein (TIGR03066 family)
MRKLILVSLLLLLTGACANEVAPPQNIDKEFLVGSWQMVGMSREVVPPQSLGKSDLLEGQMNFNADGSFTGDFVYPKNPERNTKAFGTYKIDAGILIISNKSNDSLTKSELSVEENVLIVKPLVKDGFVMYLRRSS